MVLDNADAGFRLLFLHCHCIFSVSGAFGRTTEVAGGVLAPFLPDEFFRFLVNIPHLLDQSIPVESP